MGKADDLREQIQEQMAALVASAGDVRASEQFQQWLAHVARFHRYSAGNVLLIWLQRPGATRVAGYRRWQTMGRQVRKGEKGIGILAPIPLTAAMEDTETGESKQVQTGIRFKPVHVFDVEQTDGDELPEPPDWKGEGRDGRLESALLDYAASLGIEVRHEDSASGALGWSRKGTMAYSDKGNVPLTIAHELAHELAPRWREELGKRVTESLAELVAAIVCMHFGVDAGDSPATYVATWTDDPADLLRNIERGQRVASQIIENVETRLTAENNRH